MSIYSRNLSGLYESIYVTTSTYTAQSTYNLFLANAAQGEFGVYTNAFALQSTALAAGSSFFLAEKIDGFVRKTPILNFNDIFRKLRTAYTAPVLKVMSIGYNGTSGDILFDMSSAGATNTVTYGIWARDLTPGNQPFPVQEGYATSNSTTADQYTVLSRIVSQFNYELDYERTQPDPFCYAEILTNGTKTNLTNGATVTQGSPIVTSTAHGQAVGALLSFTSTGNINNNVNGITVPISVTSTNATYQVKVVIDANTIQLDRNFQGPSSVISAGANAASTAYTSGTTLLGVRLTGLSTDFTFTCAGYGPGLSNGAATAPVTTQTNWLQGAGYGPQIQLLETYEGTINDGVGSTRNAAFRDDYGTPSLISVLNGSSVNYDQVFLDLSPTAIGNAGVPEYKKTQLQRILIAAPTGGTVVSTLQTIFGV